MIYINSTKVIFNPVREYKQMKAFEKRNKEYKLIEESTMAYVYEFKETHILTPVEETRNDTGRQDQ